MASYTNYAPGARGINMAGGATLWVEPGQTVDVNKADVIGALPDFGNKVDVAAIADQAEALAAALAEIDTLNAKIADQAKQIEDLTAPKK